MTRVSVSAGFDVISVIQKVGIDAAFKPVAVMMGYSEFDVVWRYKVQDL